MQKNMKRRDLGQRGYTLVEVLVGITIAVIVSAAALAALTGSNRAARVNDRTAQTQQNARLAMELLSRDIKMAGYGMAGPVGSCTAAIMPNDNNVAGPDTGPDSISLAIPTSITTLSNSLTAPFGMVGNPVRVASSLGFATNALISIGGVTSATISTVSSNDIALTSVVGAPAAFPVSTPVYLLQCVTYQVMVASGANTTAICGTNVPCLARGISAPLVGGRIDCNGIGGATACVAIADGIEDMQLAYGCDGCNIAVNGGIPDLIIDDQGAINNTFEAGDFISDSGWTTAPMTPDTIRLVQLSIVAREARSEGFGEGSATMVNTTGPVIVQDHNPSMDAGYNATTYRQFRRRLVTRTVEVRNIGL